jgi:hypothetical protein
LHKRLVQKKCINCLQKIFKNVIIYIYIYQMANLLLPGNCKKYQHSTNTAKQKVFNLFCYNLEIKQLQKIKTTRTAVPRTIPSLYNTRVLHLVVHGSLLVHVIIYILKPPCYILYIYIYCHLRQSYSFTISIFYYFSFYFSD